MQYDLYVHTAEYSSCSSLPADEICRLARLLGLRGIALTDHDTCWPEPELAALSARHTGQTIFNGTECSCRGNHFLGFPPAAAMDRDRPPMC